MIQKSLVLFSLLFLFGCSSSEEEEVVSFEEQLEIDLDIIAKFLKDNNLVAQSTASGLHYIIDTEGSGEFPTIQSNVTVNYKGYFVNGDIFDQTTTRPATFPLNGVIAGWQEGIPLFKKGGKGRLIIPSYLGYGSNRQNGIPRNSVLVFDIELIDF
ncbi:MAG: peptidylprolyl isomerase [Saprospiraceae bacterium]|nr:peptidylprolyl isomerase [Saprospiraceae bacterium]